MINTTTSVLFKAGPLGNWYGCEIPYLGHDYHSSEQLFMYFKAIYFCDFDIAYKIKYAHDPSEAKKLGRKVRNFDESDWIDVRSILMYRALKFKFMYCHEFRAELLNENYKDKHFVECNEFDTIWSCGLSINQAATYKLDQYPGLNLLGKCLDKLRDSDPLKILSEA